MFSKTDVDRIQQCGPPWRLGLVYRYIVCERPLNYIVLGHKKGMISGPKRALRTAGQ